MENKEINLKKNIKNAGLYVMLFNMIGGAAFIVTYFFINNYLFIVAGIFVVAAGVVFNILMNRLLVKLHNIEFNQRNNNG